MRTGWLDFFATGASGYPQPGLGTDAVSFVDDHDVAVVGADNAAIECIPLDDNEFLGVHIELLVKRGVTLLEHLFRRSSPPTAATSSCSRSARSR